MIFVFSCRSHHNFHWFQSDNISEILVRVNFGVFKNSILFYENLHRSNVETDMELWNAALVQTQNIGFNRWARESPLQALWILRMDLMGTRNENSCPALSVLIVIWSDFPALSTTLPVPLKKGFRERHSFPYTSGFFHWRKEIIGFHIRTPRKQGNQQWIDAPDGQPGQVVL